MCITVFLRGFALTGLQTVAKKEKNIHCSIRNQENLHLFHLRMILYHIAAKVH
jgi:hypothetical protein